MLVVGVVKCGSYHLVKESVKRALTYINYETKLNPTSKVLIKPNMLDPLPPEKAACTHPLFVKAVIEIVKEITPHVWVGDNSGGTHPEGTQKTLSVSGIGKVCEETQTPFLDFSKKSWVTKRIPGHEIVDQTEFTGALDAVDFIINLPKFKTHGITYITGGIKNCFGCVHGEERNWLHKTHGNIEEFSVGIVDIFSVVKPTITIMDAIEVMEGDEGPSYGDVRKLGYILASTDAVALDAVASHMTGHDPLKIPMIKNAHKRKLGCGNIKKIEIKGDSLEVCKNFKRHSKYEGNLKGQTVKTQPVITKNCVECGACYTSCPVEAISKGEGHYIIDEAKCIQCMCCHEICPYNAILVEKREEKKTYKT